VLEWLALYLPKRVIGERLNQAKSRKYPRINIRVPVDYSIGEKSVRCQAITLSGGGLFLTEIADLEVGAEISIRFRPAKRLPVIQAKARVRYVVPEQGAAIEFTEINPDDRHALLKLIHQKTGDRRLLPRAPIATQVQCENCTSLAFARDLSLGGMFIEVDPQPPVGTRLKVRFNLDDGRTVISAIGHVAYHVEKMGIGIQFTEASPEAYDAIESYLATTAKPVAAGSDRDPK
jgi:hypothetical protein